VELMEQPPCAGQMGRPDPLDPAAPQVPAPGPDGGFPATGARLTVVPVPQHGPAPVASHPRQGCPMAPRVPGRAGRWPARGAGMQGCWRVR